MSSSSNPWSSEMEMCSALSAHLQGQGWRVYPETHGFDLWAIASQDGPRPTYRGSDPDWRKGDTLGIEAKLVANFEVLNQALGLNRVGRSRGSWPRFVAVAVPKSVRGFDTLAQHLRVVVMKCSERRGWQSREWVEAMPRIFLPLRYTRVGDQQEPEIMIPVPAGVPSPQTYSRWWVAAVKITLRLRAGEKLTSKEIREAGGGTLNAWRSRNWIQDSGERRGRAYLWELGPGTDWSPLPDVQRPEIVEALEKKERQR